MSVSMHYLNKNTYSLRHPAQLCKGKNKLHYILQNSIQSRERSVVILLLVCLQVQIFIDKLSSMHIL